MKRIAPLIVAMFSLASCNYESPVGNMFNIIAHQGYWKASCGASNSIRGLKECYSLGIEGVELDVRRTVDDSLVLCHDDMHGNYEISTSTFDEIRTVRLPDGSLIPTLTEYLKDAKQYSDLRLFIDIKDGKCIKRICRVLDSLDTCGQVLLLASISEAKQIKESGFSVGYLIMDEHIDINQIIESGAIGFSASIYALKQQSHIITDAHNQGLLVNTWVVKSESEIIWCSMNNVDYVTTDSPLECKHYLYQ